jgi:hypothetical protein
MFSRLVVRIEMVDVLGVAKKLENFPDMFACLIPSAKRDVFTRGGRFDYYFLGVCAPVKKGSVQEQGVGASALSGVLLSS